MENIGEPNLPNKEEVNIMAVLEAELKGKYEAYSQAVDQLKIPDPCYPSSLAIKMALTRATYDASHPLRSWILEVAGRSPNGKTIPHLITAFGESNPEVFVDGEYRQFNPENTDFLVAKVEDLERFYLVADRNPLHPEEVADIRDEHQANIDKLVKVLLPTTAT